MLALWQANFVKQQLETIHSDLKVELLGLMTEGDKLLATPLSQIGGKGLFVKTLEKSILERRADIAVHSIKDMPADMADDFIIAAVCQRDDPRDAFVSNHYDSLEALPSNAIVGTSSLRRQCQVKALRSDIDVQSLRGNVGTRLRKLDEGQYDAIILASAGLHRLTEEHRIRSYLEPDTWIPAPGQGAIGIECLAYATHIRDLIAPLSHKPTFACITAERAMTQQLGGSCQVPVAAYATLSNNQLKLHGLVGHPDGSIVLRYKHEAHYDKAIDIGLTVANELLAQGADKILQELNI